MGKAMTVPGKSVVDMLVDEFGVLPQIMSAPVTMAGSGQVTIPLEVDLTSDTICPILEFGVTLKMTSPATNPSTVLSNIRSVKIEHSSFKNNAGQVKIYTLDTSTLLDGAYLAAALMSDPLMTTDVTYACVDPVVEGQAAGSEISTTYVARVALPFKLPPGKLKVTLNCQDITYNGTVLDFTARRAILLCPRREISATGCYIACDSRRIAGLSTFAFDQNAQMFAVVGRKNVNGGILDIYDSTTNPNGAGQPAQVSNMTLTQVTENVAYYAARMPTVTNLELLISIDQPVVPRINRPTQMSLSLFRYDVYY